MEKNTEERREFLKNASPEVQDANFEVFIDLIKANNSNLYYIQKIFSCMDKGVLEKHSNDLLDLIKTYKNPNLVTRIWESISKECQKENETLLLELIDYLQDENEDVLKLWENSDKKVQSSIMASVLEKYKKNIYVLSQLFRGTNIELSEEQFKVFIEDYINQTEDIQSSYKMYKEMFKLNRNIHKTINVDIFNSKLLEVLEIEKLVKITIDPEIQKKAIKLSKIQGFDTIISTISKDSDNWVMELDTILSNVYKYPELINNISKGKVNENTAKMLIQVFSQKENYFNISNISEAENYYSIRNEVCKKILNDEEIEDTNSILSNYSDEDKKRFAMLQMFYGIDIEEAQNLIEKYGKDIEHIDINETDNNSAVVLIGIKRILECKNIQEKYNENKEIIDNDLENVEYSSIATLEDNCIEMYRKMYEETLYKVSDEDKIEEVEYEGNKIDVYEVNKDFNMFVRAEGTGKGDGKEWEEPKDFSKHIEVSNIKYHGNCKSFIGQDSISVIKSKGPIYGYSQNEKGSLLLAAPWDIHSNGANEKFSTATAKWDLNWGIQFRTPQQTIDNTRHPYNEFVYEKLIYDKDSGKFEKDKPQYVVYIQEPDVDRETDEQWRITKKSASQLGIPIVVIDREKFAKRELEKINHLENIFLGKGENKEQIPETELLEKMIVGFENNATGIQSSQALEGEYFSAEQRTNMVKNIWGKIKKLENENFDKYITLLDKFTEITEKEAAKSYSNTGLYLASRRYDESFLIALRKKQKEAREKIQDSKEILIQKYKEFGIENDDLGKSKEFLKSEKLKQQENIKEHNEEEIT